MAFGENMKNNCVWWCVSVGLVWLFGQHILLPPHRRDGKPELIQKINVGHTAAMGVNRKHTLGIFKHIVLRRTSERSWRQNAK